MNYIDTRGLAQSIIGITLFLILVIPYFLVMVVIDFIDEVTK